MQSTDDDVVALPLGQRGLGQVQYHEYTCAKCGKRAQNTYVEPSRSNMLGRKLCFTCNHWFDFEERLKRDHSRMTIIGGNTYGPGSRTSGEFRGMAGRRFDIEYIAPSEFAGQRITTFDLWSGGVMPDDVRARWPDTAKFLNGAERVEMSGEITTCWEPSDNKTEPYPLPSSIKGLA